MQPPPARSSDPTLALSDLVRDAARAGPDVTPAALERGYVTRAQVDACLAEHRADPSRSLSQVLLERGCLSPAQFIELVQRAREVAALPARIGKYAIGGLLGEGGMGTVYDGRDVELGRRVALKVLRAGEHAPAPLIERFHREAQNAARLQHPGIVTIYEAGRDGDVLYIAMERVEGPTLSQWLAGSHPRDDAVRVLEQAARAAHYAHEHGIVHRDLKPANILVDRDGHPHILDFGLSRALGGGHDLTRPGAIVGTPNYMSPEQIRDAGEVTARTDVYALGVLLYEALAGRLPHVASDTTGLYAKILTEEPLRPRLLRSDLPRELEAVTLRAIERDPSRRYPTAGELADDLRRWLSGEPVRARPVSTLRRILHRTLRRPSVIVPAAAMLLCAGIVGWAAAGASSRAARVRAVLHDAMNAEHAGRVEEARDGYRAALALSASHDAARAGLDRMEQALRRRGEEAAIREKDRQEALKLLELGRPALDRADQYLCDRDAQYTELVRRVDEGQKLIERAVSLAPDLPLAAYLLGRAWEIKGYDDRAETGYRRAIALDAGFVPARYRLGRLQLGRAFMTMAFSTPGDRAPRLASARVLAQEGARELAAAVAGGGLESGIQRILVEAMLAITSGEGAEVGRMARAGLDRCTGREEGIEELYWLAGIGPGPAEAIPWFDRALQIRPKFALALYCRGLARAALDDAVGAIADYSTLVEVSPRCADAYNNRGHQHVLRNDLRAALADFDRAVELDPRSAMMFMNRGGARHMTGDHEGALADFNVAIEIDRNYAAARCNRGTLYLARGELDRAAADFEEALRLDPEDPLSYYNRGNLRAQRGQDVEALRDYSEALRRRPAYAAALGNRAIVRWRTGDRRGATEDADEAIRLDPADATAYLNRGQMRRELGEADAATADFRRVLDLSSPDSPAHRKARQLLGE